MRTTVAIALLLAAPPAHAAEWSVAAFLGASATMPAPLTLTRVVHVAGGTIIGRYTTQHAAAGLEVTW